MMNDNDYMTVAEAAEALGYSAQHTRLLLRQGKLKGNKIGRDWVLLKETVAEYSVRRASTPFLPFSSNKGRPSIGEQEKTGIRYPLLNRRTKKGKR